jgi:RNA polymerase sigma-70 factor, ECF subfamily
VLHHVADLSVGEIARMEGTAEGTVRSRLHRARTALASNLADQQKEIRRA